MFFFILGFLENQYEDNTFPLAFDKYETWQNKTYKYIKLSLKSTNLECLTICIGVERNICDFFIFQVIDVKN